VVFRSRREWQEALHHDELERLAAVARWAEHDEFRGDLAAEYERLSLRLGVTPREVHDPPELRQALEELAEISA
jgi:hypothetical protein